MKYKKRITDKLLETKLECFGGVLLVGPKGCGKTTTAKQKAKTIIEYQDEQKRENYINLTSNFPSKMLEGEKPILFDEWQDAPKIWGAIRKDIDDNQRIGAYLLTGSSSQFVKTPHTGTLRISTLQMYPLSLFETGESNGSVSLSALFNDPGSFKSCKSNLDNDSLIFAICRGGWPNIFNVKNKENQLNIAYDIYYQTIHTDISNVDGIKRNYKIAESILKSYARNICTNATYQTIYNDVSIKNPISKKTVTNYTNVLKQLYILEDISAFSPSIRSKSALRTLDKKNFIDPSIAVAALGINPSYFKNDYKTFGFLFESLCIRDLKIYSSSLGGELSFYRDKLGLEVDAVLHIKDGRYALIEIKLGSSYIEEAAFHLNKLESLIIKHNKKNKQNPYRLPDLKIVLTSTEYGYRRDDGVLVIPIGCLKD